MSHTVSSSSASSTDAPSLRSPRIYVAVLAITGLTIAVSFLDAAAISSAELVLLLGSVLILGIPHGAVDHLVASELYDLDATWKDQARFYSFYLFSMLVYGALWVLFPAVCLILFLAFAVYHFGQADLEYLGGEGWDRYAMYVSRGLLLVGLPVFAHLDVTAPIFEEIAGLNLLAIDGLERHQTLIAGVLVVQHVLAFGLFAAVRLRGRSEQWREFANIAVLTALFLVANPLVAFAVYFGFWHSLGHILELLRFFERHGRSMTLLGFYREALLFTFISICGLLLLYFFNSALGLQEHLVTLLFILISVLTLPHMLIVEKLYQDKEASPASAD